ncbi:MAG: hypothetical protein WB988_14450 [Candidatus Nitrosopolaris sp.]|jgi:hypothetical protein
MAEETEKEEINEETHALEDEEQNEIEDEALEPGIKVPQKEVPVVEDQQLNVLPENEEEENEEILLTARTVEKAKPKMSSLSKAKSSRMRRRVEISSASVREQLERQTTQIDKIRSMLQSLVKETKSTQGQSKLIKQLQSQLKKLQNQVTQIHKTIAKKSLPIVTTAARKKKLNPRKLKKKR